MMPAPRVPYVYQEYPACRYHLDGRVATVRTAEQDALFGAGWFTCPDPEKWVGEILATARAAGAFDQPGDPLDVALPPRRKRGRPPKPSHPQE